jgi:membrane protein YdbS with pleckstrin-like domain
MTDLQRPDFSNPPVSIDGLPRLADEQFEPLDPRYVWIRWIGDAIGATVVIVAAGVVTATWQADGYRWIPAAAAGAVLALLGLVAWLQRVEVNHLGYLVREHDLSFRQGVIGRRVTTVPFARIQNVRIDRGPVVRAFGLATLHLRTAGDGLVVPGIDVETAQRLKALVADRAGTLADEEFSPAP